MSTHARSDSAAHRCDVRLHPIPVVRRGLGCAAAPRTWVGMRATETLDEPPMSRTLDAVLLSCQPCLVDDVLPPSANDLELRLWWRTVADGALDGQLEVRNVAPRVVRVGGKPLLTPIGENGQPLETDFVVTLEMRIPDYVDLAPGQRAAAPVSWAAWNGAPASGRIRVEFPDVTMEVTADGPPQPEASTEPTNLSSSWFDLLGD